MAIARQGTDIPHFFLLLPYLELIYKVKDLVILPPYLFPLRADFIMI